MSYPPVLGGAYQQQSQSFPYPAPGQYASPSNVPSAVSFTGSTSSKSNTGQSTTTSSSHRSSRSTRSNSHKKNIDLNTKVKLAVVAKEKDKQDRLADVFSLVKTIDALEKAYIRDLIQADEYTRECYRYIGLFKTAFEAVQSEVESVEKFAELMRLDCTAALKRIKLGIPATVEHGSGSKVDASKDVAVVAKLSSSFVTAMDCAAMEVVAVDSISVYITEIMSNLNQLTRVPPDSPIKTKIKEWVSILNNMKASDELSEEQCRQLKLDLENCYNLFMNNLK